MTDCCGTTTSTESADQTTICQLKQQIKQLEILKKQKQYENRCLVAKEYELQKQADDLYSCQQSLEQQNLLELKQVSELQNDELTVKEKAQCLQVCLREKLNERTKLESDYHQKGKELTQQLQKIDNHILLLKGKEELLQGNVERLNEDLTKLRSKQNEMLKHHGDLQGTHNDKVQMRNKAVFDKQDIDNQIALLEEEIKKLENKVNDLKETNCHIQKLIEQKRQENDCNCKRANMLRHSRLQKRDIYKTSNYRFCQLAQEKQIRQNEININQGELKQLQETIKCTELEIARLKEELKQGKRQLQERHEYWRKIL